MEWREYFKPVIISRGREYYELDAVEVVYMDEQSIHTIVEGTMPYQVEIDGIGTEDMTMICDCPYAEEGNYCKHIAASMLLFEDLSGLKKQPKKSVGKYDGDLLLKKIVETDEVILKAWLYQACENDSDLYFNFMNTIDKLVDNEKKARNKPKTHTTYKKEIRDIYKQYSHKNFINYDDAMYLCDELIEYIETEIPKFDGNPMRAIKLMNFILTHCDKYSIDDSGGGLSELHAVVIENSNELIPMADEKQMDELFDLYINLLSEKWDYASSVFEEIFENNFNEEKYLKVKLTLYEAALSSEKLRGYQIEYTLEKLIAVLQGLKVSENEILLKLKPYFAYEAVKNYQIKQAIDNKAYDKAIQLLKEGLQSELKSKVIRNALRLLTLYEELGHQDYVYFLFDYVANINPEDYERYELLKLEHNKDEWEYVREYIFKDCRNDQLMFYLMEERLYDRALDGIEESEFSFALFLHYLDELYQHDSKRTMGLYEQFVNQYAALTSNRKEYKKLISHLKEIKRRQGDQQIAERMEAQWRVLYKKRPALIDELNKAMR